MKLWEYIWFQNFITWCRKWSFFDTYIYGKSINLEDACRNPAEVLRDTYFPFIIKDVYAKSIFNLRCGYKQFSVDSPSNSWSVPMGDNKLVWRIGSWTIVDLRVWSPWWTKFCNAMFFLQFAVSFKNCIPIPYISMCIKIAPWYFQLGLGWGPEVQKDGTYNAVLCGKFRFVNELTSNEAILNPTDVKNYDEGTI